MAAIQQATGVNGNARNRESTDDTRDDDKKREPDQHAWLHMTQAYARLARREPALSSEVGASTHHPPHCGRE
jgi:hypothetical protein